MFNFYTSLIFFQIAADLIMMYIIFSNKLIEKKSKEYFKHALLILVVVLALEWKMAYIKGLHNVEEYMLYIEVMNFLYFVISPLVIYFNGSAYKETKFSKLVLCFIVLNFFMQIFIVFSDKYYISAQGYFNEGNLNWVFNLLYTISIVSMLISMWKYCKECQTKNGYVLIFIVMTFTVGNLLLIFDKAFVFILLSANFATIFLYAYYISVTNKVDILTNLLNRRCYENRITDLRKDCVIIYFDLDKFKYINDTYGHSFGDEILKNVSHKIFEVYGKYGNCFRTGGDEFCVILYKNTNKLEELNRRFEELIFDGRKKEPRLTTVSYGYSYFYKDRNDFKVVSKEADDMLYRGKANNR